MKKLLISDHGRTITLEERLAFAKLSRAEVVALPDEQKLRYFFSLQVSHAKLKTVEQDISRHLGPYSDARILTLIGPPGAGKTTFAKNVMASRMKPAGIGLMPFLFVAAPAHGSVKVPWSGVYRKVLEEGEEPLIDRKRRTYIEDGRLKTGSASRVSLDALRSAVESMLRHRQTRLLALDEVLHLLRFGDPKALMDTFKSLADATDCQLLLIGSYDLFAMVTSYAQVGRRSEVFYLDRYRRYTQARNGAAIKNHEDTKEFTDIVRRLQNRWPLEWVPNFVAVADDLLDITLGIVGLLKDFMYQCLVFQLENGGKWSNSFVKRSLKPVSVMKGIRIEVEKGEAGMVKRGYNQLSVDDQVLTLLEAGLEKQMRPETVDA